MAIASPTFKSDVDILNAEDWIITNLTLATPSTEVTHTVQPGIKQIVIRSRTRTDVQIATIATESSSNYITIKAGCSLSLTEIDFTGKVLYMQSPSIAVLEILELYT